MCVRGGGRGVGFGTEVSVWLESRSQRCGSEMYFFYRTRGYSLLKHTNKIIARESECQVISLYGRV